MPNELDITPLRSLIAVADTRTATIAADVPIAARYLRANFRRRYAADGGPASTGSPSR